jgi:predicted RNA binding protein YcfA (HicA-like mRNA interferase family)
MGSESKTIERILRGTSDANIAFKDLCNALTKLGFDERVKGDHHIFTKQVLKRSSTFSPKDLKQSRIKSSKSET